MHMAYYYNASILSFLFVKYDKIDILYISQISQNRDSECPVLIVQKNHMIC